MKLELKTILSLIATPIIAFFEPINPLLPPILWLILIDILTGIYLVRVVQKKPLTSRGFFQKFPQAALCLVAIVAALHADPFFIQFGLPQFQVVKMVVSFYGLYELFSILENLGNSGLPIAKQLSSMLSAKLPEDMNKLIPEAVKLNEDKEPVP